MINTLSLFPVLDGKLIDLLKSLSPSEWNRPTVARLWTVKDVAAHLLDTTLRTLSMSRDRHMPAADSSINSYQSLVDYLNRLNAAWVDAFKRVSPEVLTGLLEQSSKAYAAHLSTLDPEADALFPVAWAGEEKSKNWFHIAREYTERWHHQQQIRDAVGKQGIITRELFRPCVETFLYGLPHSYRNLTAPENTSIKISIATEAGGSWFLKHINKKWVLCNQEDGSISGEIIIPPDTAWKVFTKAISPELAAESCSFIGDRSLLDQTLRLIAVMA